MTLALAAAALLLLPWLLQRLFPIDFEPDQAKQERAARAHLYGRRHG